MIKACIPLSLNHSPKAQPEYGAKNCKDAESEEVAATIIEYDIALAFFNLSTTCATVERF
jgi:hypothetical protein